MNFFNFKNPLWWMFLLAFVLCLFGSGSSIIYILDEAKNSEAAREMLQYGNVFRPTFNDVIRTDKPPFHYFFMMIGYQLFGVNAFGARFFSALFGAFTIVSTFIFTKKHLGNKVANTTYWVLLSSFYFIQEFHLAVPDPYLIFWMSLTFFCYIDFFISRNSKILWLLYFSMGFGVLTKGPVAIALPTLVAFIHLVLVKQFTVKQILLFKPFSGLLLVLLVSLPWFYMAHVETVGVFTEGFFLKHNVARFQDKMEGHGGIFLITIGFVILGMLPFSLWIFRALFYAIKQKTNNKFVFFSAILVIVFVSFFAISATKLPNYTMPCYPFIAILLAWFFQQALEKGDVKYSFIEWAFLILIAFALPVAGYIGLSLESALESKKWIALLLIFIPIGVVVAFYYFIKKNFILSFKIITSVFIMLSLLLFGFVFPQLTKESPVEKFKEHIASHRPVIVYQRMDAAFPINFNRSYKIVDTIEEIDAFFKEFPNGVVMTNTRNKDEINELSIFNQLFSQKSLFENHTTRVYEKKSNKIVE
ncbi:glycosyltransferase family 39 protein [Wenyingzhuangia sp. chi5]|uniref:Glycosyltransferase family 39 protein n=1 Tax=Wenyingzhuangia gilva TaxID=3057677 RepID=A0ABT8VR13_9FLAO|nr:glycosyltransferase family 39 protein [Wenyingzhuangia sp. chi5]MDO3694406.1 glycosyltransferase family 39 protein [Wenyingzhuangia sp. chi5]